MLQILDICLFVAGGFLSPTTRRGDHVLLGERMDMTYDAIDSRELINSEIRGRKGRVAVSCTFIRTVALNLNLQTDSMRGQRDKQQNP